MPSKTARADLLTEFTRQGGHTLNSRRPSDYHERLRRAAFHEAGHAVIFLDEL
jgi:hypothetical protein